MTDSTAPAVSIRGLEVHAEGGGPRLLGPLDLDVERGAHVLVVGASGSGKSTLLRAIAGLAVPSAGTIRIHGELVSDGPRLVVPPERRGIGFLFQGGAHWPHMTVRRALDFALRQPGAGSLDRATRAARTAELVALCELGGLEDRLPGALSGGEAQRLNLARALARAPRLVLLDEPLGPLDAPLRAALLERIDALQREQGWTALHVTHDPAEAAASATATLTLASGQVEAPA